ncbi:uncharacterized protein SCODWIG_02445 [Saccharomycodes ludwigii]|uniref:Cleft lip and palate transmembrane protein 1 n=1 Tax=Saccharomycodes ludwigii TaxID=36035 RepID=A0A376B848_9ASCO|nr:hypothetical protein SCDLUD_004130 [Saccharomycodes ludwigii]KAH3899835.1 hypothetical protein SCDLUD_004130 [Saccharomycodes ludwigii]SSD60684.1 uncharacterized protein SCODWIG_02445 [Saccharomycodes ludwigii]
MATARVPPPTGFIGFLRYAVIIFGIINIVIQIKKITLPNKDTSEESLGLDLVPGIVGLPSSSIIQKENANLILENSLNQKYPSSRNVLKTRQRQEYELNLELLPKIFQNREQERFVIHQIPSTNLTNISYSAPNEYDSDVIEVYNETVPTREWIVYENSQLPPQVYAPVWNPLKNNVVNLSIYINNNATGYDSSKDLQLNINGIDLTSINDEPLYINNFEYPLLNNNTNYDKNIYIHTVLGKSNYVSNDNNNNDDDGYGLCGETTYKLTHYFDDNLDRDSVIPYVHPNISLVLGNFDDILITNNIPSYFRQFLTVTSDGKRDNSSGIVGRYFPFVFYNNIFQTKSEMLRIGTNITNIKFTLDIKLEPLSEIKKRLFFLNLLQKTFISGQTENNDFFEEIIFKLDRLKNFFFHTDQKIVIGLSIAFLFRIISECYIFLQKYNSIKNSEIPEFNLSGEVISIVCQIVSILYLWQFTFATSYYFIFLVYLPLLILNSMEVLKNLNFQVLSVEEFIVLEDYDTNDQYICSVPLIINHRFLIIKYCDHYYHYYFTNKKTVPSTSSTLTRTKIMIILLIVPLFLSEFKKNIIDTQYITNWKNGNEFAVAALVSGEFISQFIYLYGNTIVYSIPNLVLNYKLKVFMDHVEFTGNINHRCKQKILILLSIVNIFIDFLYSQFIDVDNSKQQLAGIRDLVLLAVYVFQSLTYESQNVVRKKKKSKSSKKVAFKDEE